MHKLELWQPYKKITTINDKLYQFQQILHSFATS